MEANGREMHGVQLIASLDEALQQYEPILKARVQTIPDGWRRYRAVTAMIDRLVRQILDTLPMNRKRQMNKLIDYGEIVIRLRPVVKEPEDALTTVEALKVLAEAAMEGRCAYCLEQREGIKHCTLRKALMDCLPPDDLAVGECPYRYAVEVSREEL